MQAVRVDRSRSLDPRWLLHLSLLGAVSFLFSWVVTGRPTTTALVESLPISFLAPPSAPVQDWRPIRVPVRTSPVRDPAPPRVEGIPSEGVPAEAVLADGSFWVQAHRRSALLSSPDSAARREIDVPQWGYLRVFESRDGWLRVGYGRDANGQPANVAWVSAADVGLAGAPPTFVMSTQATRLWTSDDPSADAVGTAPDYATFELAGLERNGRVAVKLADDASAATAIAWVDWDAVTGASAPVERALPLRLPFSSLVTSVRMDVPYRTQLDGSLSAGANCGPTSISMAMEAFGVSISIAQARAIAMRSMGINNAWSGTTLESLRDVARSGGLEGVDLYENGRYKRWTLDDVRRHLRAGHPVVPQLRYRLMPGREWVWVSYDHYVVITGMVGDDFIYNDPVSIDGQGERVMSGQALLRAWMNSDAPGAALAVARPL
jgi:hypothetical protein